MERNQSYQLVQAKRAIASGGLNGFGWRRGPYIQYNYLPDRHNDFIFAIVAHQWGFWGCMGILSLYGVIIFCGIEIASSNTDPFAKLIAVGIISMFAIQVIVNIGMNVGLMPITGITLPLISYGGSSLVVNMAAIGLLQNIGRVRPYNLAGNAFTY
jgi:rod shape determining protein RodA